MLNFFDKRRWVGELLAFLSCFYLAWCEGLLAFGLGLSGFFRKEGEVPHFFEGEEYLAILILCFCFLIYVTSFYSLSRGIFLVSILLNVFPVVSVLWLFSWADVASFFNTTYAAMGWTWFVCLLFLNALFFWAVYNVKTSFTKKAPSEALSTEASPWVA